MVGIISTSNATRIPATPAKADPNAKVKRITLSLSMPDTLASSGSLATARIACPTFVYLRKKEQDTKRKRKMGSKNGVKSTVDPREKWGQVYC
jgi:hypothetical protein